ncbi:hypothetical protein VCO01S_03560 [Vibrio comitans NBRC 102076]|uniref:J domain-containing protein n=2 Tax=Vibrio comitans TaxID=413401 RepID=A0A4Y3II76_9VIBR|nr:hypothetical protein VCO01S_03560 [Vibrio comitans NBRC 102076]
MKIDKKVQLSHASIKANTKHRLNNDYTILTRGEDIKAVNCSDLSVAEEVITDLKSVGFTVVMQIVAISRNNAIVEYKESIKLSPIEEANLTIRKANQRISDLKLESQLQDEKLNRLRNTKAITEERLTYALEAKRKLESEMGNLKATIVMKENEINLLKLKLRSGSASLSDLQLLGFKHNPTLSDLKVKYKRLTTIYHPDKGGCDVMMAKINSAYTRLRAVT